MLGSISWFEKAYDATCSATPVIFHPANKFDKYSSPTPAIRVIETNKIVALRAALRKYAAVIARKHAMNDEKAVQEQLDFFALSAAKFLNTYSVGFTVEK
jgi:hypothetical protein